jgi:hypothetical protein
MSLDLDILQVHFAAIFAKKNPTLPQYIGTTEKTIITNFLIYIAMYARKTVRKIPKIYSFIHSWSPNISPLFLYSSDLWVQKSDVPNADFRIKVKLF